MRAGWRRFFGFCLALLAALLLVVEFIRPAPVPDAPQDRALEPLAAEPLRIVVFGTSLSARGGWPDAVAQGLGRCFGAPVEMIRIAQPGGNITWAEGAVAQVLAAAPDLVLMEFAINDADIRDGVRLGESRQRHEAVLDRLGDLPVMLMTMNTAFGLRGWLRPWLADYYASYREMAAERGLGLLDFAPRWAALPRDWADDGLHPRDDVQIEMMAGPLIAAIGAGAGKAC